MKSIVTLAALAVAIGLVSVAQGAFTAPINNGPEVPLIQPGGVLDQLYGLANLTRIDDFGVIPNDQLWYNPNGDAYAQAKYASWTQDFGYIKGGVFGSLMVVNGSGLLGGAPSVAFTHLVTGNVFKFADDPSGNVVLSSMQSDNAGGIDHMVTYEITGNAGFAGNVIGNYVLAWEDQDNGDFDYNDLVVEVHGVRPLPVPAAAVLGVLGLGLAGWLKRRVG